MGRFSVVTFSDKELDEGNLLKKSCVDLDLELVVLRHSPWTQNAIKLHLLNNFLQDADPDQLILVVDATDVVLFDGAEEIVRRFEAFHVDLLISAEANYFFKKPRLWWKYLRKYPSQPTFYNFVNSGSYMGSVSSISATFRAMEEKYDISMGDREALEKIKSDQYLFHRFFVDNHYDKAAGICVALDSEQKLMGCTGGRTCIKKFPDHSKAQAFAFWQSERNLVKIFNLHRYQHHVADYIPRSGRLYNVVTGTSPSVIHLPGTWRNFSDVFHRLLTGKTEKLPRTAKAVFAELVSYFSYGFSILGGLFIAALFRKKTGL